jgi:hypothetical protein
MIHLSSKAAINTAERERRPPSHTIPNAAPKNGAIWLICPKNSESAILTAI